MVTELSTIRKEEREDPLVDFAIKLRSAWQIGNFVQIFRLYEVAPRFSGYLIEKFLPRERKRALKMIIKAYAFLIFLFLLFLDQITLRFIISSAQ